MKNHKPIHTEPRPERSNDILATIAYMFDTQELGDGDPDAGLNLLTAYFVTTANLAPEGSGLLTGKGKLYKSGCSFFISGSHSSSLVSDYIPDTLTGYQDNLLSKVQEWNKSTTRQNQEASSLNAMDTLSFRGLDKFNIYGNLLHEGSAEEILSASPGYSYQDLLSYPLVFLTASTPATFSRLSSKSQRRKVIVEATITCERDFSSLSSVCAPVMNGCYVPGSRNTRIKGNLMVTDASGLLGKALHKGDDNLAWVYKTVWLLDDTNAQGSPPAANPFNMPQIKKLDACFKQVTPHIWAHRFTDNTHSPVCFKHDFGRNQSGWIAFLKEQDSCFPGITGTARSFLASLAFGIKVVTEIGGHDLPMATCVEMAEVLARHLIRRMVSHRTRIMDSAEAERNMLLQQKVLKRLGMGIATARDIYRALNLSSSECRELLGSLVERNLVVYSGGSYELAQHEEVSMIDKVENP